jgi:hypothetical protein
VLVKRLGERMRPVRLCDEVQIVSVRGLHHRQDRVGGGTADWARRQAVVRVCVVR